MNPHGSIIIKGLRIYAHHGVLRQERTVGNMFEVDLELHTDFANAMEQDDIDSTVNYAEVIDSVKRTMATPSDLLENVVYRIIQALREEFPLISSGRIALYKLQPPISAELDRVGFAIDF